MIVGKKVQGVDGRVGQFQGPVGRRGIQRKADNDQEILAQRP